MGILKNLFQRWTPSSEYEAQLSLYGNGSQSVTDAAAMRLAPAYRACVMIARDIARAPRRIRIGSEYVDDSPVLDLLKQPHPMFGGNRFFTMMVFEMMSRGQSLAVIVRDGRGDVVSLVPMASGQWSQEILDGRREVQYRISGVEGVLQYDDVLHFRLEEPGGFWMRGVSPWSQANGSVQQMQEQETTANAVVQNLGRPRLGIRIPQKVSENTMNALRESYRMHSTGANKAGTVMFLPEGMDLQTINPKVVDAEFEAARRYSVDDVARLTGVPASLLANRHDVKYSTLSDEYASYVSSALDPYAQIISGEFAKMTGNGELAFSFDQVLRPSPTEQANQSVALVNAGILTQNEARRQMGLSPIENQPTPQQGEQAEELGANVTE